MDVEIITQSAIETVGVIQILKNFMPEKTPTWIYSVLMVVLGFGFTLCSLYAPKWVSTAILTVCVAQLGYEGILQTIKKMVAR